MRLVPLVTWARLVPLDPRETLALLVSLDPLVMLELWEL